MRSTLRTLPAVLLLLAGLSACGDDSGKASPPASSPSESVSESPTESPAAGECSYTTDGAGPAAKEVSPPPTTPESVDELTIATNRGDIKVTLDSANAPCTVNSFVSLAKQGYFDDTDCHRLVIGFVLQCGDPTGTGSGGPGYRFDDELTGNETYPAGTLAMANAGPATNGSQFFIVLEDAQLPPDYTVFGAVDDAGLQVARDIAAKGNGDDGVSPKEPVTIESVS